MTIAGRSRVVVYAMSTSVGASPVPPGKTYPLSVLDHAMSHHTLQLVFYYRPGPTMDRNRLMESISDTLSHYHAMTGRLMRGEEGGWVVKCNDAGVRVLDAKAEVTVDEWLASATAEEEADLAYWEPLKDDSSIWSPYYVQITEFKDKGFAIALSCTHMHADPTSAILFIKAWGDVHRRAQIAHAPFFHPPALAPRSSPNITSASADFLLAKSSSPPAPTAKMSSVTFCFSDNAVQSCIAEVGLPDTTPFNALASLFWWRIATARGCSNAPLTLAVDIRKLLHAPLPFGFYGNAFHFSSVKTDLTKGWAAAAAAIATHTSVDEEEYWSAIDWLGSRKAEKAFPMYGPELTCVKLDHEMAYEAVFEEGGKPVHVTCRVGSVEGEGVIMVMPAPEEGSGRTVTVTLPEEVMSVILKDEEILKYGATVLFGGKI